MKAKLLLSTILLIVSLFCFAPSANAQDWCHTFVVTMQKGDRNDEVTALQTALMKEGLLDISQPTGYFWTLTFNAVVDFQEKYTSEILTPIGLSHGTGKVAGATRAKLNQIYGCSTAFLCTDSNWTYNLFPTVCPSTGIQTRSWTNIGTCSGGVTHPSTETVSCTYQANTCTSFSYSNWSACSSSGTQTRSVLFSLPSNCTGGNPLVSQTCAYIGPCTETNWASTLYPTACPSSGVQTKIWNAIGICSGGITHAVTETVNCNYLSDTCTSFSYSNWSTCSSSGVQTRSVISSSPSGCSGGNPVTSQSCTYVNQCTDSNWTYLLYPIDCPSSGQQIKVWNNIGTCSGGVTHALTETVSCNYQTSTCASFEYSNWTTCSSSGVKTRTVISSSPSGCTGGNPEISQSCTYINPCIESDWTYTLYPTTCPSSGTQTKTWTKIGNCSGGINHNSSETSSCNYQTSTCTSFSYSDWGSCSSSGIQTRSVISSSPSGCTGGNPVTSQSCTYTITCTESNWTSTLSPVTCPSSGTQTRTWAKVGTCSGGVSHNGSESVWCDYQTPTCTSFTYSNWSACSSSGMQTRSVISSSPSGCSGGNPATSQSCSCTPNWSCSNFGSCVNGEQERTCTDSNNCGTTLNEPDLTQSCAPPPEVDLRINNSDGSVSVSYNTPALLSWDSSDAVTCTASGGWSGAKASSGSQSTAKLTSQTTFTITCIGSGGVVTTDSVTAKPSTTISVDLRINDLNGPISVTDNNLHVTWSSANTTSCTASGSWSGTKATYGSEILIPAVSSTNIGNSSTYTITCTGASGTTTDSVVVTWTSSVATIDLDINGKADSVVLFSDDDKPYGFSFIHNFVLNWAGANIDSCSIATTCTQASTVGYYNMPTDYCAAGILSESSNMTGSISAFGSKVINIDLSPNFYSTTGLATPWSYKMRLSKTYKITCTGPGGMAIKQITAQMTFKGPQLAVTCMQNSDCGKTSMSCVRASYGTCSNPPPGTECMQGSNILYNLKINSWSCISANTIYAQCYSQESSPGYGYLGISCTTGYPTCTSNWSCGAWGACVSGQQSRTCTDTSTCSSTCTNTTGCRLNQRNKQATTQSCTK